MMTSDPYLSVMPVAQWRDWSINNAVKDGYIESGWVYRAISMIARTAASVPWVVFDPEGKITLDHQLTPVLARPNPIVSRQDMMELLVAWLMLSGESYVKKAYDSSGKRTLGLWPISPDRIAPIASPESDMLVGSYEIINEKGARVRSEDYNVDNIIQLKLLDPSNPIRGISPLQAAAKAVDTDNEQKAWNKAAMQNRGVLDGFFSFDRDIDQSTFDLLKRVIKERFSGSKRAREPGIIGSAAKYQQLSLSPVEMDFLESRRFNREEIFIIFGVPPQLAGSQDNATYNNYSESLRIFWQNTIIPLLDDVKDTFNHSFNSELGIGYNIGFDLSSVEALRDNEEQKAKTAKLYYDMGVPVSELNRRFNLGIEQYEGWDVSSPKPQAPADQLPVDIGTAGVQNRSEIIRFEVRNVEQEINLKNKLAEEKYQPIIFKLLTKQKEKVFNALESGANWVIALESVNGDWEDELNALYSDVALRFYHTIKIEHRAVETNQNILDSIQAAIIEQSVILETISAINKTTTAIITDQAANAAIEGMTVQAVKDAIMDAGAFSSERALRIARTETGTASSIGQLTSAHNSGATHKTWHTSGFEVRTIHQNRSGETVEINQRFSSQNGSSPRYPCDPNASAGDRINCRCSMTFEIRDGATPAQPTSTVKPAAKPATAAVKPTSNTVSSLLKTVKNDLINDPVTVAKAVDSAGYAIPKPVMADIMPEINVAKLSKASEKLSNEIGAAMADERISAMKQYASNQVAQLNEYVNGDSFIKMNAALRSGAKISTIDGVTTMDSLFLPSISDKVGDNLFVYRGGVPDSVINKLNIGSVFKEKGYMSTSASPTSAAVFSYDLDAFNDLDGDVPAVTVLRIVPKTNSNVVKIGGIEEKEVLFERNRKMKVVKINDPEDVNGTLIKFIDMVMI